MPLPRRAGHLHPSGAGASARYGDGLGLGLARFLQAAYDEERLPQQQVRGLPSQAKISRRDPCGRDLHSCRFCGIELVLFSTFDLTREAGHSADGMHTGGWRLDGGWTGGERSEGAVIITRKQAPLLAKPFCSILQRVRFGPRILCRRVQRHPRKMSR